MGSAQRYQITSRRDLDAVTAIFHILIIPQHLAGSTTLIPVEYDQGQKIEMISQYHVILPAKDLGH